MRDIVYEMSCMSDGIGDTEALKRIGVDLSMTEKEMAMAICAKAKEIAKELKSGKDIVITKSPHGIVVKKLTVQKV